MVLYEVDLQGIPKLGHLQCKERDSHIFLFLTKIDYFIAKRKYLHVFLSLKATPTSGQGLET